MGLEGGMESLNMEAKERNASGSKSHGLEHPVSQQKGSVAKRRWKLRATQHATVDK